MTPSWNIYRLLCSGTFCNLAMKREFEIIFILRKVKELTWFKCSISGLSLCKWSQRGRLLGNVVIYVEGQNLYKPLFLFICLDVQYWICRRQQSCFFFPHSLCEESCKCDISLIVAGFQTATYYNKKNSTELRSSEGSSLKALEVRVMPWTWGDTLLWIWAPLFIFSLFHMRKNSYQVYNKTYGHQVFFGSHRHITCFITRHDGRASSSFQIHSSCRSFTFKQTYLK